MRLADAILRRGHLSETALAEICMTGERPVHLERCDICAARAVELGRWLDEVRAMGLEEADAQFPAERLAVQQAQILRRLEQLDRPARVIAFPNQSRYDRLELGGQGIRPAWIGIAAAAGLVLGLLGGQISARLTTQRAAVPPAPAQMQPPATSGPIQTASFEVAPPPSLFDLDEFDRPTMDAVEAIDRLTPHSVEGSQFVLHTGRQGK